MKTSLVVITKNEEINISRCIDSLKDIVDEIIVVDTGSTDNTVSLAKNLGAKIFYFQWNGSFADARNYAIEQACGDWIIFLDADESFSDDTRQNVKKIIEINHTNKNIDGIGCILISIDLDTGKEMGSCPTLRIFRNQENIRYYGNIHEVLKKNGKKLEVYKVNRDKLLVYHTGYSQYLMEKKLERNLEMLKKELEKKDCEKIMYYYIADVYKGLEENSKAVEYALKFIEANITTEGYDTRPYVVAITCMINSNDRITYPVEHIFKFAQEAYRKFPYHPEFARFLGFIYILRKEYSKAMEFYKKALALHEKYNQQETNDFASYIADSLYFIGSLYETKNDVLSAIKYYFDALKNRPNFKQPLERLLILNKNQPSSNIIQLLNEIYKCDNKNDIEFLVAELSKLGLKVPAIYYQKIWNLKMGMQDITTIYAIIFSGEYETSLKILESNILASSNVNEKDGEDICLLYSIAIIMGNLFEKYKDSQGFFSLPKTWSDTLFTLCSANTTSLPRIDTPICISVYIKIIKHLIIFGYDDYKKYLHFREKYSNNATEEISNIFFIYRDFESALLLYRELLEQTSLIADKKKFILKIALCEYNLNKYKEAVLSFKELISLEYQENDIFEYLSWIEEKIPTDSDLMDLKKPVLSKKNTLKISGCIIAKNEEKTIARCINSMGGITHEIIVIDTGSTDNTKQIAKSLGVKLFEFQWNNDFSAAKNFALDKAEGDWIIFLDADEYLDENTSSLIPDILCDINFKKQFRIVQSKMINIDVDTNKIISTLTTIRIFRNNKSLRYFGEIHEFLKYKNNYLEDSCIFSAKDVTIFHTGYTFSLLKQKQIRNIDLLEKLIKKDCNRTEAYYYLGESYKAIEDYEKALEFATKFLSSKSNYIIVGHESRPYFTIISSMLSLYPKYDYKEIHKQVEIAIQKFPFHPEAFRLAAKCSLLNSDTLKALEYYEKALKLNENYSHSETNAFPSHLDEVYSDISNIRQGENQIIH